MNQLCNLAKIEILFIKTKNLLTFILFAVFSAPNSFRNRYRCMQV